MSIYDINFAVLTRLLLPVRLRKDKMEAWLKSLVAPVEQLHNNFTINRADNVYQLSHNSQVVYLQAALNDVFDPISRGIIIEDGAFEDPLFTYLVIEEKPLSLGLVSEIGTTTYPDPQYLYTDIETSLLGNCFIVKVPASLSFDIERMKAAINKYRLPGKNTYDIVTY
jgi:hypothetical protein